MSKGNKKQALGRGLSALLKENKEIKQGKSFNRSGQMVDISLDDIDLNPFQPRTHFSEGSLHELTSSIQVLGIIQPITVRAHGLRFQLVSGERRFRAAKNLGLDTIPAYVRVADDQQALEMALVENIQRQDLDPIEISLSYQRLIEEIKLTQEQLSERVGKKRSTITNYLRLLKLDPIIQTGMRDGFISMGHGRALINIKNKADQLKVYERVLSDKLSVRQTEELVRANRNKGEKVKPAITTSTPPKYINKGIKAFGNYFGHKIKVKVSKNGKGTIVIPFHSEEDFKRLTKLVQSEE